MIQAHFQKSLRSAQGKMQLDFDLEIKQGQLLGLYGKSGAGKTTVLRILAGLLQADSGQIVVEGQPWLDVEKGISLRPQQRSVGLVFQDYALFPNMTVRENLNFALGKGQDSRLIEELIEVSELQGLQKQKPAKLSGGQKQRVALARALVQMPPLLLLDEPFSAVDQEMRIKLQDYLLQVHQKYALTIILISHDITEIIKMADQVVELEEGKIIRKGPPHQVFLQEKEKQENTFHITGTIIAIKREKQITLLTITIYDQMIKIPTSHLEGAPFRIGDRVQINAKALTTLSQKGSNP
ncbi:MAG: ATP-binding cassette domain-containing protein [Bacteroidota bacterium]